MINPISNENGNAGLIKLAAESKAEVIGLAMEHGMPKTTEDRLEETRALLEKCDRAGLAAERRYVDMICMSVGGSGPEQGAQVLQAIQRTKDELGGEDIHGGE